MGGEGKMVRKAVGLTLLFLTLFSSCSVGDGTTQKNIWTHCSTKTGGCAENEGDCDNDAECMGDLVCGRNSCGTSFNAGFNSGKFFPKGQADCCITAAK